MISMEEIFLRTNILSPFSVIILASLIMVEDFRPALNEFPNVEVDDTVLDSSHGAQWKH